MDQIEQKLRLIIAIESRAYLLENPGSDTDEAFCIKGFNNFHRRLPFGGRQESLDESTLKGPLTPKSQKTCRQFYEDMDDVVKILGLDLEKFRKLQQEKRDSHTHRELLEYGFPVYVELIKRGYTRSELNS